MSSEILHSRRSVLKSIGIMGFGVMLPKLPSGGDLHPEYSTELPLPKKMYGVDVYGVDTNLTTGQLAALYDSFDKAFDARVPLGQRSLDKWEQRRALLSPNIRYLEEIVTRDVYKAFEERRAETGVGLVEYLKMHADLLNRMIDQVVTVPISVKIDRIIVSQDLGLYRLPNRIPGLIENKDIDARWTIDKDPRSDNGYFWLTDFDTFGNLIMRSLPGDGEIEKTYMFPKKDDSLVKRRIWIDMGLIHEWVHQLLNVPDEYIMNVEKSPFHFRAFNLDSGVMTNCEPSISPYVLAILKRSYDRKIRGYFTDPLAMGVVREGWGKGLDRMPFWEVPPQINFSAAIENTPYRGTVSVFKNEFEFGLKFDVDRYYNNKIWSDKPNYQDMNEIVFPGPAFQMRTTCPTDYLIRFGDKELFVPVAIFNMTHWAGSSQSEMPRYKVSFTRNESYAKTVQRMQFVHQDNLSSYIANHDRVYATLAIVGTPFYAVYTLQ
jgi:hypothetical protein